jgi:drug/metabolite transporter (DMT)-like permease
LKGRIALAFAAVYLIWGSTYLAIRFAIETMPPYPMGGLRFLIAGALLYGVLRLRGTPRPTRVEWKATAIVGGLLLFGGNGSVILAEKLVPSGLAAVIIAMVPIWMVLLNWRWGDRVRPNLRVAAGLLLGVFGLVLLSAPDASTGSDGINPLGVAILVLASLSWSIGSLYSRRAAMPANPLMSTAMEMLAGGVLMMLAGVVTGQTGQIRVESLSALSLGALAYLVIFGSLVGFSAYVWLLKVSTPARVSTYAFVNPVVAVFLGWALAGEPLTPRVLLVAAAIVIAVILITTQQSRPPANPRPIAPSRDIEPQLAESA